MSHYIVRGKHFETDAILWIQYHPAGEHCTVPTKAQRTEFLALSSAIQGWCDAQVMMQEPRIFSVSDDGTETPLPTYEEALAALQTSRAQAIAEAATWLRERANATDAEVDDDCDGEDADRLCAEAELLRKAADDMEEWNAPAKIERLRSAAESLITIEDVTDSGTEWLVSFDGPNPTADRCVHVANRGEAAKLTMLVASLFDEVNQ